MTTEKETSIGQLKYFLKEMFQFNTNDLDFGIYRIYNLKRKEIENFIDGNDDNCLEQIIYNTLEMVANNEKKLELSNLGIYLKKYNQEDLLEKVQDNFKQISLFIEANKNESEKEELLFALNSSSKDYSITDEIKDKIYNHILSYFEMYYSNGDFGYNNRSRNLYKVPYEADYDGSDTLFHWKHKGSIYIKTGNSFNAIKFKLKHLAQEFELRLETNEESNDEEVAQNNNKDTKLKHYKFNRFEVKDGVTRIVFNLSDRSTTKSDLFKSVFKEVFKSKIKLEKYLFADDKPVFNDLTDDYDKVLDGAVKGIGVLRVRRKTLLNKVNKNFDKKEKITLEDEGKPTEHFSDTTLETIYNIDQKLNSFYIGNDSDYFIHENLQEFLTNEKERYIKNHILSDLESILNGKLDNTTIIIAKAFELVICRIVDFLSAIEEFQKKLFTMKKKVVECEYCLTIDNIDEKFYKEIFDNKAQLTEWENLFSVKVKTIADLKTHPTLVLDTKFFREKNGSNPFKDKILEAIESLDEKINGVLINSENYQALGNLSERYRAQVSCIHIDPPYNSNTSGFLYKNHFRHSSWISMMENRLSLGYSLLTSDGSMLCHIDENEYENLHQLLNQFKLSNAGTLIWDKRNPMNGGSGLALQHEYVVWNTNKTSPIQFRNENALIMLKTAEEMIKEEGGKVNEKVRKDFSKWINSNKDLTGGDKAYKYIDDKGFVYQSVSLRAPEPRTDEKFFQPLIHPITKKPCAVPPNGFSRTPETLQGMIDKDEILFGVDETIQPRQKVTLKSETMKQMPSLIQDAKKGKGEIAAMGLKFPYNHSTSLYEKLVGTAIGAVDGIMLDFFAGSGTSGHSVININRIGSRNIKYILVEMGNYFNSITKPRIQKALYTNSWKGGKPKDIIGSKKHIFKYFVLEQYEDVLDAIEKYEGKVPKNLPLKYLYKPELNKLNSTLDLSKPFSNRIRYGQPTKEGFVDLVETYNYLQGHEVKSIRIFTLNKKYYKVVETLFSLVIWRDISLGEDDSKNIIFIAGKYTEANSIEINFYFDLLSTQKGKQLKVGNRELGVSIIHSYIFNQ